MAQQDIKREIAYLITIEDIKKFPFFQQPGWLPNYIEYYDEKISRINIIATIILKSIDDNQNLLVVDDGTDQIELRTFENDFDFQKYNIGEIINIIGRIREFNNNRYIIPETIKKIKDIKILELRKRQLIISNFGHINTKSKQNINNPKQPQEEKIEQTRGLSIYDKIMKEIKKIDKGDGASIQEILVNTNLLNKEELITELLQKGDIFEISPGKVKVLE